MKIKRYIVNNMSEAMNMIRYELGREAVIISQRKVKKPGFLGYFMKKQLEVTAAVDNSKKQEEAVVEKVKPQFQPQAQALSQAQMAPTQQIIQQSFPQNYEQNMDIMKEIQDMRNALNEIKEGSNNKVVKKNKIQLKLENNDVSEALIKKILTTIKNIRGDVDENTRLRRAIEKLVTISDDKMQDRVILIGPTGVGKTTTIAKLAGRLSLTEKKKVGLLTVDTYRIGAVDQLKTYADILNLPFKVVLSLKDMEAAIESMADCDVILIDTTGRSSKNVMQISELRAFVEKANASSIHLVISCTTKEKDITAITEGFRELNYNNVIITKLDETTTYGSIVNILDSAKKPLSFVTTGQNVPDDLMRITKAQVSDLILGEFEQVN